MGDMIRFIGEDIPAVSGSVKSMLTALFMCGDRFLAFLEKLEGPSSENLEYLKPFADKARDTLMRHGLFPYETGKP
jgi:hypothetical protein